LNHKEHKEKSTQVILYVVFALQSGKVAQFREDPNTDDGRIFNAKSQRREGAKSFFLLGVSAPSRLCVKRPLLYRWNPGLPWFNTFWLRLAALCSLR
jgi:hypothetical protein